MERIWTCKTMTFINHSRLQLQIMSCSPTHGIVTISHINSLCYMCTIIYLYLYKEWCHNIQARLGFPEENKLSHQMHQHITQLLSICGPNSPATLLEEKKFHQESNAMPNLVTKWLARLPNIFFFWGWNTNSNYLIFSSCTFPTYSHISAYLFLSVLNL